MSEEGDIIRDETKGLADLMKARTKWIGRLSLDTRVSDHLCSAAASNLQHARRTLEQAINATPTGKRRNLLTEVNMQMMLLEESMKKILETRVNEGEG